MGFHGILLIDCINSFLGETHMNDVIFRQYDIRGKVGTELDINQAYDVARALAYCFVQKDPKVKTVVLGMDGRTHSPALKDQLCAGILDSGLDVHYIGVCSSPVVYFAMHTQDVQAGLMVTASHNSKEYNGIKICLGLEMIWGDQIQEIKQLFKEKKHIKTDRVGLLTQVPVINYYVDWLAEHFKHLKGMEFAAIVDCGNGAAGAVLPQLIKKMEWHTIRLLYPEVDGEYPNHDANPIEEKNMRDVKQLLATTDAQIGIGLDGDADRMAAMTKEGYLIPGDKLLGILSKPIVMQQKGAGVVFDVTCSSGLLDLLKQRDARPIMSPTGSSYIKQYMKKTGALFGGEVSCHFFYADRYFGYDDGIYAMMRLFEQLIQSGETLSELVAEFPVKYSSDNLRMPCADEQKESVVAGVKNHFANISGVELATLDGIRVTFKDGSWGLVRASNTEPKLSIRFEADSPDGLEKVKDQFLGVLRNYFDDIILNKYIR